MSPKLFPLNLAPKPRDGDRVLVKMVEEIRVEVEDKVESEVMVKELVVTLATPTLDDEFYGEW